MILLLSIITFVQGIDTVFTEEDWSVDQVCILSRIKVIGRLQTPLADTPSIPLGSEYDIVPL